MEFFVIHLLEGPLDTTITALSLFDQILAAMSLVSCDFGWRTSLFRLRPHNTALLPSQKPAEMTSRCCGRGFKRVKSPEFARLCASLSSSVPVMEKWLDYPHTWGMRNHLWPCGPLTFVPFSPPGVNVKKTHGRLANWMHVHRVNHVTFVTADVEWSLSPVTQHFRRSSWHHLCFDRLKTRWENVTDICNTGSCEGPLFCVTVAAHILFAKMQTEVKGGAEQKRQKWKLDAFHLICRILQI